MISTTIHCVAFIILSFTVHVNSETCQGVSQYGQCSTSSACGCLHLTLVDDIGICGLLGVTCSRLVPCEAPYDACENPNYVCVRHPRCNYRPVCYPLSMSDHRLCPLIPNTMGTNTTNIMQAYTTETTETETTDIMDTTMVMTTSHSTTADPSLIISNYHSALTVVSGRYPGMGKYFQAVQVTVNSTGYYTFKSSSSIDTYGYLYNGDFYPSNPSVNLITDNDDGAGDNQFQLAALLKAGVNYTLVVTTWTPDVTGPFTIVASGPDDVDFLPIDTMETNTTDTMEAYTTETTEAQTTRTTETETTDIMDTTMVMTTSHSTTADPSLIISNYHSALTVNSGIYSRGENPTSRQYYEAISVIANTTGDYTFTSSSNIDTYGYLYQSNFSPLYPSFNIKEENDDGGGNGQFKLAVFLRADSTYILVVTTFGERLTGSFSIAASGPNDVIFIPTNSTPSNQ